MGDWHVEFLERCAASDGVALGDGAFAPGPAVWVGKREVAHFDGEHTLDVRLTKELIRHRRAQLKGDARVSLRSHSSEWLEVQVLSDADIAWARALIHDAVAANLATAPPGTPPTGAELQRRRRFH